VASPVLVLVALAAAGGGVPTVAVMPFKNLAGTGAQVGEAIRETVSSDLRGVTELRVLERGNVDRVLQEERLQEKDADLDAPTTARVGKLLGATMIVIGAYQQSGDQVRLTARFVQVETGEIVGTAKVDGPVFDFLKLQDQVTVELLKSLGAAPKSVRRFQGRARPPLRSLKPLELYAKAVVEKDDAKRRDILRDAVKEEPAFDYAAQDLAALEERMKGYDAAARKAEEQALAERRAAVARAKSAERGPLELQLLGALMQMRRYHELLRESREVLAHPEAHGGSMAVELAGYEVIQAEQLLKDWDALLRDGERFLKRAPGSPYFSSVETLMRRTIDDKRKVDEGKEQVYPALTKLRSDDRWDLCRIATVYEQHAQFPEARRLVRACIAVDPGAKKSAYVTLVRLDIACADWPAARQDLASLEREDPPAYKIHRSGYEFQVPIDD
jgi:TolB-like protein